MPDLYTGESIAKMGRRIAGQVKHARFVTFVQPGANVDTVFAMLKADNDYNADTGKLQNVELDMIIFLLDHCYTLSKSGLSSIVNPDASDAVLEYHCTCTNARRSPEELLKFFGNIKEYQFDSGIFRSPISHLWEITAQKDGTTCTMYVRVYEQKNFFAMKLAYQYFFEFYDITDQHFCDKLLKALDNVHVDLWIIEVCYMLQYVKNKKISKEFYFDKKVNRLIFDRNELIAVFNLLSEVVK